jgi:hypothetical protein
MLVPKHAEMKFQAHPHNLLVAWTRMLLTSFGYVHWVLANTSWLCLPVAFWNATETLMTHIVLYDCWPNFSADSHIVICTHCWGTHEVNGEWWHLVTANDSLICCNWCSQGCDHIQSCYCVCFGLCKTDIQVNIQAVLLESSLQPHRCVFNVVL